MTIYNIQENETNFKRFGSYFLVYCLIHLLFWTILPFMVRGNLHVDTIEGIIWGRTWELGFNKHPFLAAWLSNIATILGQSTEWPLYLIAQVFAILVFLATWLLARKILKEPLALISCMLLQGIWYYNILTPKFNPNTLMAPMWALTIYAFYLAYDKDRVRYWLLTGALSALCILTKYQSVVLLVPMFVFVLASGKKINALVFKIVSAFSIFVLFLLPNLFYIISNKFTSIAYIADSTNTTSSFFKTDIMPHLWNPFVFLLEQFGAMALMFILIIPLLFCKKETIIMSSWQKRFIIILGLGPLITTLLLAIITGMELYSRWGAPYFTLAGILIIVLINRKISFTFFKKYFYLLLFITILIPLGRGLYLHLGPKYYNYIGKDAHFPGKIIANDLTTLWHDRYNSPLKYIVGSHYLVANISLYSSDRPQVYFEASQKESPWIDETKLLKSGGIISWWSENGINQKYTDLVKQRFPKAIYLGELSFEPQHVNLKQNLVKIHVSLLPPM